MLRAQRDEAEAKVRALHDAQREQRKKVLQAREPRPVKTFIDEGGRRRARLSK